jgi:hypothetical protein
MALGLSASYANRFLDYIGNATAPAAAPTNVYLKLHVGDPGSAGTANPGGNDTRKIVSFGTAASGLMSNDVAITWTGAEVDTSEDYTHWSLWDNLTAGNFVGSGLMTANAVTIGDEFTIPVGELDLSFNVAA